MSKKKKAPTPSVKPVSKPIASTATVVSTKPGPAPNRPIVTSTPNEPLQSIPASSNELIRFDKRVKWFLGICVGLFLLLTLARIHTISIPIWNQILPDGSDAKKGLISGTPRGIRMDDYCVGTPWMLSQANNDFPTVNETLGGEKAPVLITPSRHFSEIFKPDHWGFFVFSAETGYAWMYNFRICAALIGALLMLLLLTRNNFWLSATGSVWLILSTGTVSWSNIPAPLIAGVSFIFVAVVYLLYSQKPLHILLSAVWLGWLLMSFALILYPPYQVPLGYALAAILIGYVLNRSDWQRLFSQVPIKLAGGAIALAVAGVAFYLFYTDLKPTLTAITSTVYPGKRSELGGTGFIANWFSEYFSWQVKDQQFPKNWLNHCELSHYLTFAPIIIPSVGVSFWLTRRVDWVLVLLSLFIIVGYLWIEVGFPEWLAKATLWNMSPTRRTQIPFGIANVLLTVLYLHYLTTLKIQSKPLYTALGAAGVLAFMIYAVQLNIDDSAGFFKWHQLFVPMLFFAGLGALLLSTWQPPYRNTIFCAGILLFLLPNLRLNPVSKGLAPITDHALYRAVQEIHQREPNARWAVFGSQYISYLVTATGVKLLSGVKYVPERNIFKVLDPAMKRDSAYNRYAHTVYQSFINGTDSVIVQNTFEDAYTVAMDPCSPRFKKLNVKYIIFDKQPQPVEVRCMKEVSTLGSLKIYRIND